MKLLWIRLPQTHPQTIQGKTRWLLYCPQPQLQPDAAADGPQPRLNLLKRLVDAGERKWAEYGRADPDSLKGQLHRLGQSLIDKLPVQEKMWWRVEAAWDKACAGGKMHIAHGELPGGRTDQLAHDISGYMGMHWRAWLGNTALSIPVLLLTWLPFVKLVLAWTLFRAVTHRRAYHGCRHVMDALNNAKLELDQDIAAFEHDGNTSHLEKRHSSDLLNIVRAFIK